MTYEDVLALPPFGVGRTEKQALLCGGLLRLTEHHRAHCAPYARMMETVGFSAVDVRSVEDVPFLPVRLFKEMELRSVAEEDVFKTMTSSGTTGQQVSRIFLDRKTAANQQKTLVRIVSAWTGKSRMPMLIIDCPSVVKNRAMFSARGAGILGFSIFGRKKLYALNDAMELQLDAVRAFLLKGALDGLKPLFQKLQIHRLVQYEIKECVEACGKLIKRSRCHICPPFPSRRWLPRPRSLPARSP